MDIDNLIAEIKEKLYELQTAFDESELSEEAGACYPVEEWLKIILAAYSAKTGDGSDTGETPDPEQKPEQKPEPETPEKGEDNGGGEPDAPETPDSPDSQQEPEWMKIAYWETRLIQKADKDNRYKGYNPNTCAFWIPSGGNDPYGFNSYVTKEKNIISIIKKVAYMLDYGGVSYKQFNNIHLHSGDRNFTVGFQHLAGGNERRFFAELRTLAPKVYEEMCQHIVYKLVKGKSCYRQQVANDPIMKPVLFPGVDDQIDSQKADAVSTDEWLKAIRFFFSTDGALREGDFLAYLSNRKYVSYLNKWAEDEMIRYYCPDNSKLLDSDLAKNTIPYTMRCRETPPKLDIEDDTSYAERYSEEERKKKNSNETEILKYYKVARLFNCGNDPNKDTTGFWFYEIVKETLMLKSVAAEQIKYWLRVFYYADNKIKAKIKSDLEVDDSFFNGDLDKDDNLITAVLTYSAMGNNKFSSTFSKTKQDALVGKYGGQTVAIEKSQYLRTNSPDPKSDEIAAKILLRGIMYKIENPERNRLTFVLKTYWKNIWGLKDNNGNPVPITDIPNAKNCRSICRL